jgi:hypothetical protein
MTARRLAELFPVKGALYLFVAFVSAGASCSGDEGTCCTCPVNSDGTLGAQSCTSVASDQVACNGNVSFAHGNGIASSCVPVPVHETGRCLVGACETLASGLTLPQNIAVDATNVYWTDTSGTVSKISTRGGPKTEVASGQGHVTGLAMSGANAYWGATDVCGDAGQCIGLWSVPIAGGLPMELESSIVAAVAADSTDAYWTASGGLCPADSDAGLFSLLAVDGSLYASTGDDGGISHEVVVTLPGEPSVADGGALALCVGTVNRLSPGGGDLAVLASGQGLLIGPVAVDSQNVYWANAGSISEVPKSGGASMMLVPNAATLSVVAIAANGQDVYWLDQGSDSPFFDDGRVMRVPVGGGVPTVIASGQSNLSGLAIDATSVYWTSRGTQSRCNSDGSLMRAPLRGGAPVTLVANEEGPSGVALDATSVYWISAGDTTGGTLRKLTPK